jgi:hypothetical protein
MKPRLLLAALSSLICALAIVAGAGGSTDGAGGSTDGAGLSADGPLAYEVWLIDQEDKFEAGTGTLHVFDGVELARDPASASAETVDLGGEVAQLCRDRTGSQPARPHMLVFNGGDQDGPGGNTHAVIAYVASGHVAFLDAATREPVGCIDVGTQAHAAWPTPDQRHLIVANQNGKRLQRIATDYATDTFTLEDAATIDLATCTTPSGAACQDPQLRPDNAPICPRTTGDGTLTFVTLRGGGMFVVDQSATPMRIVAEYDRAHVDDNGCGEMEAAGRMYVNSGAGAPDELWGHDVYAFDLAEFADPGAPAAPPNTPAPQLVYSRDGHDLQVDAHAVTLTRHARYLWWGDRSQNDVTVVDPETAEVVGRFGLAGPASDDPAPDLFDLAPDGKHVFASLRGPNPASGHEAFGSTPGVGVIRVRSGGRDGELGGVARIASLRGTPDPHAIRVRTLR